LYLAYASNAAVTLPAGTAFAVTRSFDTFTLINPNSRDPARCCCAAT
jgi:hypothetical protein